MDRLPGGNYILGYQENEYRVAVKNSRVEIVFPDGREIGATAVFLDDEVYFPFAEDFAAEDLRILGLAAKVDRVFQPKGGYIVLATIIAVLGAAQYGFPVTSAKLVLELQAWMIKDPEPTEAYVLMTKITGGLIMLGGWIFLLWTIWK